MEINPELAELLLYEPKEEEESVFFNNADWSLLIRAIQPLAESSPEYTTLLNKLYDVLELTE